jgi:hypothetical protein
MLDDREAETGPSQLAGAGLVHPIEAFEDAVLILSGNTCARVSDLDPQPWQG